MSAYILNSFMGYPSYKICSTCVCKRKIARGNGAGRGKKKSCSNALGAVAAAEITFCALHGHYTTFHGKVNPKK
ncbi:hypothetical protein K400107F7_17580 [Agathobaculum massiliense]